MIKNIVEYIFTDYNSMPIPAIITCLENGLKGEYGKYYTVDTGVVLQWIERYNSEDLHQQRLSLLREKRQQDKTTELQKMQNSDMHQLLKDALELSSRNKKKPVNKNALKLYEFAIRTYTDEELEKAIKQHVQYQDEERKQLVLDEILKRDARNTTEVRD